jgi:hypothetical protein
MSRRGLLPRAHRRVAPMLFAENEIPFGAEDAIRPSLLSGSGMSFR